MGLRLQCTFYSNFSGNEYTISVYDEAYAGSVIDFTTDDTGFLINWQGEGDDMKVPVLTSKCEVNIIIDKADIESFVTSLNTAYEGQMRMKITSGSSGVWYGIVLTDLVQIEDLPVAQLPNFKLVATDGIKRLQKIPYKDTGGPYSGQESITQHLVNAIGKIGLTDLMTEEAGVLKSQTNWRPADRIPGDDMDHTYVDHRALYQVDEKGNIEYNSVYRVIEQLCYTFHAKFLMADGWYWFVQHNEYENDTVSPDEYTANKTALGATIVNSYEQVDSKFTGKYGGGYFGFFPPLNRAQINYIHFGYANIAQGYTWSDTATQSVPVSPTEFRVPASTAFFFKANFWHQTRVTGERPYFIKFDVTLTVGIDYLQYEATSQGTYTYPTTEQTITASVETYELFVQIEVGEVTGGFAVGGANFPVEFDTIAFTNEGAVTFDIAFNSLVDYNGNTISTGVVDNKWKFSAVELIGVPTNDVGDWTNTKRYTAYNATTGNSEAVVVNKIIGESFGYGILRNDTTPSGKVDSTSWGVGASDPGVSIEELLGNEYIRTQSVPIKKMVTKIESGTYNPVLSFRHNSDTWIFYKGKWAAQKELFDAEWYLLDTTGTTSGNTDEDIVIGDIPDGGNDVTPSNPTGGSGGSQPTSGGGGTPGADGTNGVNSVLDALFPRTTADINSGATVTTIPVVSQTEAGVYKAGQVITIVDPFTGQQQDFTVTADSAVSDTTISVSSTTANFFFREGSWIITSQEQQAATGGGSAAMYSQEFTTPGTTLTVTENGGNLPANEAAISVFWDNGQWISPNYYTVSGSDITLTFTPSDMSDISIWVRFTA